MTHPDQTPAPAPAHASAERMVLVPERLLHDTLALFDCHPSGHWFLASGADVGDVAEEIDAALVRPVTPQASAAEEIEELKEITVEEFVRREGPNWAHVKNAVDHVRAGRGDLPSAEAGAHADLTPLLGIAARLYEGKGGPAIADELVDEVQALASALGISLTLDLAQAEGADA